MGIEARSQASPALICPFSRGCQLSLVHLVGHRLHHQERKKHGQGNQHLIRRRGLRAQRLAKEVQYDNDPAETA